MLMCSAGLRVGALSLRIRDLEPIEKYGIYKVNVYATSRKSRYFTFCSVECRKEINIHLVIPKTVAIGEAMFQVPREIVLVRE